MVSIPHRKRNITRARGSPTTHGRRTRHHGQFTTLSRIANPKSRIAPPSCSCPRFSCLSSASFASSCGTPRPPRTQHDNSVPCPARTSGLLACLPAHNQSRIANPESKIPPPSCSRHQCSCLFPWRRASTAPLTGSQIENPKSKIQNNPAIYGRPVGTVGGLNSFAPQTGESP